MRKKKDLPLVILKSLEPFVKLKGDKFEIIDPKENLLTVIDKDSESTFLFTIAQYKKTDSGKFQFLMNKSPKSQNDNSIQNSWVDISDLNGQFEAWVKLLREYETTNSFYDDPIVNSFREEFYSEFEIVDEDADTKPFSTKQILLLDNYLESVEKKLNEFSTEQNKSDIQDIQTDIELLRDNLTTKSKKWVVSNLSKIWAKIAKQGTKFIKEFLSDSKKEIIKQSVKGLIEFIKESGTDLLT